MSSPSRAAGAAAQQSVAQQIADALRTGHQGASTAVKLPMPTYDGKPELLKSFLSRYETWCTVSNLSDTQAAETAQFALTGTANIWFLNQSDDKAPCVSSWQELRVALTERFTGKLAPGELAVLLDSLNQKASESVQDFVDRVHRAQHLADEAADEAGGPQQPPADRKRAHDRAVCMQFLRGLKKSIRRVVCARESLTTLADFVKAAKAAESAEKDNPTSGAAAAELSTSSALEALNIGGGQQTNRQGGRGRGRFRQQRRPAERQDSNQRLSFASTVCYNCNKVGHISTFCPTDPNSSANKRSQQQQQPQQGQRQPRQQFRGRGGRQQRGRRNNQQQQRNQQPYQANVFDYAEQPAEQEAAQAEYTEEANTLSLSGYSNLSGSMQDFFE